MSTKEPSFSAQAWTHVYKRRADENLIFYTQRDFLVYFTVFCTLATRLKVQVLGLTLMHDHIHELLRCPSLSGLRRFERDVNAIYAKMWNEEAGIDGVFFNGFGYAQKRDEKHRRNNVAYLANNPVERRQCSRVEAYRWNFIAYAVSKSPYSHPIRIHCGSRTLDRAMVRVRLLHQKGRWLTYPIITELVQNLPKKELSSFIDFVISTYNIIDYKTVIQLYGSYERMLLAINANTGNEHDIRESFVGYSDAVYLKMFRYIVKALKLPNVKSVITLRPEQKNDLVRPLQTCSGAVFRQVEKFLHLHSWPCAAGSVPHSERRRSIRCMM